MIKFSVKLSSKRKTCCHWLCFCWPKMHETICGGGFPH